MKMRLSPVLCLVLVLLLTFVESGRVRRRTRERVRKQQLQRAKQHVLSHTLRGHRLAELVKEGSIAQPLDHFDQQGDETFPQRFFVNEAYWDRPHGPVFLYIGGEEAISEFSVLAGHHVDMAEEHGALLVALEHRFYGDSINPDGLETENLADLSSVQALADIAEFHRYVAERFDLSHLNTWISFGGSYAGALSAWFRGKFPHLVYGAVASSAPVKAKLDFSTFNKIVGLSLMNEDVGGSQKCVSDVWEAFAAVEAQLMGGNATEVAKDFGCCEVPEDLEDQIELMQSLADIITGTVEFNDDGSVMSIDELCVLMTNKSEAYEEEEEAYDRFVRLVQVYRSTGEEECLDASHEQAVKELLDTSEEAARTGDRQWMYQCCTEFGFFETCEDASCPFSRMMTLQAQTQLCQILFDIPEHSLAERIAFTNMYYGADHPRTHRVLYVNGGIDPWQELSVVKNGTKEGEKDQAIFIEDTSHCADMMMSAAADSSSLKKARKVIENHVAKWLKVAAWENMLD